MLHTRRRFLKSSLVAGVSLSTLNFKAHPARAAAPASPPPYELNRHVASKYFDGEHCWCHPRAGIVPGAGQEGKPRVVMTMNSLDLEGSDVFRGLYSLKTDDLGQSWTEAKLQEAMVPRFETINEENRPVAASDFWPGWHAASKTLLGTGHTVVYTLQWYVDPDRERDTTYATYDPAADAWSTWKKLQMPDNPGKFFNAGAGCTQRLDEPDGSILLPFYFYTPPIENSKVAVMRCSFDGQELKYVEHGDEIGVGDDTRGLHEPSLTKLGDRYFLTIRHDERGYVTRGTDGLHFEKLRTWKFDDGSELGNYNTQQHWVAHSDGLFLVYTRRGLNNDHVFRNRAPLLMAQVDPEQLHVIRSTEQILVPERGAGLGNFGVTDVSPSETWVTVSEWMQPRGCEKYGSDGSVYVARIQWEQPNKLFKDSAS